MLFEEIRESEIFGVGLIESCAWMRRNERKENESNREHWFLTADDPVTKASSARELKMSTLTGYDGPGR